MTDTTHESPAIVVSVRASSGAGCTGSEMAPATHADRMAPAARADRMAPAAGADLSATARSRRSRAASTHGT